MKLQKKIMLYFITASFFIFILANFIFYFIIQNILIEEVDDILIREKTNVVEKIQNESNGTFDSYTSKTYLEITEVKNRHKQIHFISDTLIFITEIDEEDRVETEAVSFRQLKTIEEINGKNYLIIIRRSLIEKEDLIITISLMLASILLLIFFVLNLINYHIENKLWQPFYNSLQKLSNFKLEQQEELNLPLTNITEFSNLNATLNKLTDKLLNDFRSLKELSENVSHEIQTPLAIIRSKLDLMIQDNKLSNEQLNKINSIYESVNKLSKLNQSLLLITKIENEEFENIDRTNISETINILLAGLEEIIESKELVTEKRIEENIKIRINPLVAEILFSNLIVNAVKHNIQGGKISISLNEYSFSISNTGKSLTVHPEQLFERFKKDNQATKSIGLGLSIVKKICEKNGFDIKYENKNNLHFISINF